MERLSFKLQVVTPLFMSGADQRKAELRPPSIRGALRFWFRALAGPVLSYDWRAVQQAEALLFGSTDQSSCWFLRVRPFDRKASSIASFPPPLAYLGYGPIGYEKSSKRYVAQRVYYPPGSSCQLEVGCFERDSSLAQLLGVTFWVWGHLGGLGSRVRRGFGAISLQPETESVLIWSYRQSINDPQRLAQELQNGLEEACVVFAEKLPEVLRRNYPDLGIRPRPVSEFFTLDKRSAELYVGQKVFKDWQQALAAVGTALMGFRRERPPDYGIVRQFITSSGTPPQGTLERTRFGLPLNFYFKNEEAKPSVTAIREWEQGGRQFREQYDRRASPLMIRVMPLQGQSCCIALLHSKAEFLPAGTKLLLAKGKNPKDQKDLPIPTRDLVEVFLKDLFNNSDAQIYGKLGGAIPVTLSEAREG